MDSKSLIIDFIWEVLKSLVPQRYRAILEKYVQMGLDALNDFSKDNLVSNKKKLEKLGRYCFWGLIPCLSIGWIKLSTGIFAVMVCLFMLGDSIKFYSNINRNLKKLITSIILWALGLTILCYLALTSNLEDALIGEASLRIQIDLLKLMMSFIAALLLTLFYHIATISILSILFFIFKAMKGLTHAVLKNKYLRGWIIILIDICVQKQMRNILHI